MVDYELDNVYTFRIGEAFDDLRPVFLIDGREYADAATVRADVAEAAGALTELGLLHEWEMSDAGPYTVRLDVPTWAEWRRRHLVDGEPIGVRPIQPFVEPAEWSAMFAWLEESRSWLLDQAHKAAAAVTDGRVFVQRDGGPRRTGRASVVGAEERYVVDFMVFVRPPAGVALPDAFAAVAARLTELGWVPGEPNEDERHQSVVTGQRDHEMAVVCTYRLGKVTLIGRSPTVDASFFAEDS